MGSVATLKSKLRKSQRIDQLRLVELPWQQHFLRVVLFSIPFVGVALLSYQGGFLSENHAHLVAKTLLAADRRRLEVIGFLYPPLPFLLTLVLPHPFTPSLLASIAAGATTWLLWYDLERTSLPRLVRMLLVVSVVLTPGFLFLATQSLSEILALHLVLVAWHYYLNFIRFGHTFSGFVSGLVLGFAFYVNFYALLYALTLAILVPLFKPDTEATEARSGWFVVSQVFVTAFPALWAVLSWTYINWVFTGNPVTYLVEPGASVIDEFRFRASLGERLSDLTEFGRELALQPLLWGVLLLQGWKQWRRVLPLLLLISLPSMIRLLGLSCSVALALSTYAVLALAAVPERLPRWVGLILVTLAAAQAVLQASLVYETGEIREWEQVVVMDERQGKAEVELTLGRFLHEASPAAVLADDRSAYRVIARTRTARPFLLPADENFAAALASPAEFVQYVLVTRNPQPRDRVSALFGTDPPAGFILDGQVGDWFLYRREEAPPLLTSR